MQVTESITMSADSQIALPEGVREGNEKLIALTAPAGGKLAALIEREQKATCCG